ncbi:thiopeptide-type bacteriocin biosynthesis protein [Streptomyces hundungensis]|uniref:thiopeptide-type bacteriocin biosynthesis protein n=1 Tax=Streptomyces hundungensis TaxID=1077946 RepID=UPI0033E1D647
MLLVAQLLNDCLQDAQGGSLGAVPVSAEGSGYEEARRAFVAAGLAVLGEDGPGADWVQVSLESGPAVGQDLYHGLAETARELLATGAARNFFFMHKPPGMRVRFQAPVREARDALRADLTARFADGAFSAALSGPPVCGVYEPETYLFGGAQAMPWVHGLFTADSLAWLDHHAGTAKGPAGAALAAAQWRVSLALLRELFDGLGIVGWEHRGVWEHVRDDAGRRLWGDADAGAVDMRRAAEGIRAFWRRDGREMTAGWEGPQRAALDSHRTAVGVAARRWRTGYFESGDAKCTGPRRAAAYCVIFHWNRGRLSLARQSLLAEALASPEMSRAPAGREEAAVAAGVSRDG